MAPHNTAMKYQDGEPVPFRSYQCKSTITQERGGPGLTMTHRCKRHIDHDLNEPLVEKHEHRCICGKHWPPLANANKE